jgi:general secretion pathway protein N
VGRAIAVWPMSAARMPGLRLLLLVAALLAGALVAVVATLPVRHLDPLVESLSYGRVRLVDAQGSWWRGQARVVLLDGSPQARVERGLALPAALGWEIRLGRLLLGELAGVLKLPGHESPVAFEIRADGWSVGPGRVALARIDLSALGSPWNTIRPSASPVLGWEAVAWRRGQAAPSGRVTLELREVASAMTPVRPLGDYRVEIRAADAGAVVELTTQSGSLRLAGAGRWDPRSGLRMQAEAWGEGEDHARLQPLLALIGQRQGERTLIRIGG